MNDARHLLTVWEAIGKANPWIAEANDPEFDRTLLKKVDTLEQLELMFQYGNWCLGQGFYYRNLQDSAVRVRHQMNVFLNTFRLRTLGFPVCHALPHAFEYFGDEVRCAEPFMAVLAALGKTDLFRTHEVPRIKAVLDTLRVF